MENYQPEEEEVGPSLGLRRVARGAGGSLVAQVAGLGLGYVLHVCLAQWMGVDGYGLYTYVLAWTALLALPAAAGFPISVIRFLPAYQAHKQWGLLRGFLGWSISRTVLLGSVIVLLFGAGAWAVVTPTYRTILLAGAGLILVQALFSLLAGMLRGMYHVSKAHALPVVRHAGVLLGGWVLFLTASGVTPVQAVALTIAATAVAGTVFVPALLRALPAEVWAASPRRAPAEWWRVSLPLLLVMGFTLALHQTDLLMVGSFLGTQEAGLYAAASRTAMLVNMVPIAIAASADPMVARLYAENNRSGLQVLATAAARWALGAALGVGVVLVAVGGDVLRLFGVAFSEALPILLVLTAGHTLHAGFGLAGALLNLTGHQKTSMYIFGACALLNLGLNALGIWLGGMMGVALATVASIVLLRTMLWWVVRRKLHIDASVMSGIRRR